jgi:hypothetical protein
MTEGNPKQLVQQILCGDTTLEQDPWLVDDDILAFSLEALARTDPGWLLGQLVNTGFAFDARLDLLGQLNRPPRGVAVRFMHRENPQHPIWKLLASQLPPSAADPSIVASIEGLSHPEAQQRDRNAEELRDRLNSGVETDSAIRATEALLDVVLREADVIVLESALNALADAASRTDLVAAVDWSPLAVGLEVLTDEECLLHALEALEAVGDSRYRSAVLSLQNHPSSAVQTQVETTLRQMGNTK